MRGLERAIFLIILTAGIVLAQPSLHMQLAGRWWRNAQTAEKLGLSADQQKRMDGIFDQNRPNLIDLAAALDKEEAALEPLVDADPPDTAKIRARIDRVAQARAELEKANANMLLGLRLVLSQVQWRNLHTVSQGPRPKNLPHDNQEPSRPGPVPRRVQ
jgi:Spy/CpxP family protein refolding chaperone